MTRLFVALALVAAAGTAPPPVLQIQAVAFDRSGNPVTDLKQEEIEVWINGFRVPIQSIAAVTPSADEQAGRLIVLLLDNITIDSRMAPRVRETARRFVTKMLPEDRMAVVLLNGDAVEITADPSRLLSRVESFNQSIGFVTPHHLGTQVLATISALSREVSEAPEPRKFIVAIGSGGLLDTPIPPPQVSTEVRREWLDAVRAMALADVSFYVIDPAGVGTTRAGMGKDGFARDAGGHAFLNTNDLSGAVDQILREARNYYVIAVSDPPVGRNAPLRELDVRSLRRNVTVRARRAITGGSAGG